MRVTKTIREYIETQVYAKAKESVAELKKKAEERKKNIENDIEILNKECKPLVQKLLDKYPECFSSYAKYEIIGYDPYYLPEEKAYREAYHNACNKAKLYTIEIIAEMELGGTKAELAEKINNLKF